MKQSKSTITKKINPEKKKEKQLTTDEKLNMMFLRKSIM